jgi:hypothetical protein
VCRGHSAAAMTLAVASCGLGKHMVAGPHRRGLSPVVQEQEVIKSSAPHDLGASLRHNLCPPAEPLSMPDTCLPFSASHTGGRTPPARQLSTQVGPAASGVNNQHHEGVPSHDAANSLCLHMKGAILSQGSEFHPHVPLKASLESAAAHELG